MKRFSIILSLIVIMLISKMYAQEDAALNQLFSEETQDYQIELSEIIPDKVDPEHPRVSLSMKEHASKNEVDYSGFSYKSLVCRFSGIDAKFTDLSYSVNDNYLKLTYRNKKDSNAIDSALIVSKLLDFYDMKITSKLKSVDLYELSIVDTTRLQRYKDKRPSAKKGYSISGNKTKIDHYTLPGITSIINVQNRKKTLICLDNSEETYSLKFENIHNFKKLNQTFKEKFGLEFIEKTMTIEHYYIKRN